MSWDLAIRFVVGGVVVSAFAVLGDVLKPKSFAGLFGAAPSVALATLGLTIHSDGKAFASEECRSMLVGAAAFVVYAYVCMQLIMKYKLSAMWVTTAGLFVWLICAVPAWWFLLR